MERKYGQRGYMQGDRNGRGERSIRDRGRSFENEKPPRERRDPTEPRRGFQKSAHEVIRCHKCAGKVTLESGIAVDQTCSNCDAELHCCRSCTFFDPGAHKECRIPDEIPERITVKDTGNECPKFTPKTVIEYTITEPPKSEDVARKALEKLFKI